MSISGCEDDFAGLQHHRTTGSQRRRDLARNLILRPVPWRDQATHANWLAGEHEVAFVALPVIVTHQLQHRRKVREPAARLGLRRETARRAHFTTDRLAHLAHATLVNIDNTLQRSKAARAAATA